MNASTASRDRVVFPAEVTLSMGDHELLIDAAELEALVIVCTGCQARVVLPFEGKAPNFERMPQHCPKCGEVWKDTVRDTFINFKQFRDGAATAGKEPGGVRLRFQLRAPKAPTPI